MNNGTPKFTGNKDVDMMILKSLDDESMRNLCQTNKYISSLCKKLYRDERFWKDRFENFGNFWSSDKTKPVIKKSEKES